MPLDQFLECLLPAGDIDITLDNKGIGYIVEYVGAVKLMDQVDSFLGRGGLVSFAGHG